MTLLTPEDLETIRNLTAEEAAITMRPDVFSKTELIEHFKAHQNFMAYVAAAYNIEGELAIDVYSGQVTGTPHSFFLEE